MFVSNGDMPPAMAYVGLAALEQPGSRATECKVRMVVCSVTASSKLMELGLNF